MSRWRGVAAGMGVATAVLGTTVVPSVVSPETAPQAQAAYESVWNASWSTKSISARLYSGGVTSDHIIGRNGGVAAGANERFVSWLCPRNTRCQYTVNDGSAKIVTGPVRINIPNEADISVATW